MTFRIIEHYAEFDRFLDHVAPGILRYCRISCIIFSIEQPCPFIVIRLLIASYFNASNARVRFELNLPSVIISRCFKSSVKSIKLLLYLFLFNTMLYDAKPFHQCGTIFLIIYFR